MISTKIRAMGGHGVQLENRLRKSPFLYTMGSMPLLFNILLATFLSGTASLMGGIILLGKPQWVKKFSIHFVSFTTGALLAAAFFDLLPEAFNISPSFRGPLNAVFFGIVLFFIFEMVILKFHTHHYEDTADHHHSTPIILCIGDAFHNAIDGIVIATTFLADFRLGLVTSLAVAAHELPQEIGDFSIMLHHGWARSRVLWINILISLTSIIGALAAYRLRSLIEPYLAFLLAFTAGSFIYIAASDLIPEISAHRKNDSPVHIILLLLIGAAAVWGFTLYFKV